MRACSVKSETVTGRLVGGRKENLLLKASMRVDRKPPDSRGKHIEQNS